MTRPFHELLHADDALPLVQQWIAASPHLVEVLPCAAGDGQRTLEALQVSTRSPLAAIGYHTGGLLLDGGWLRILGAGSVRLSRSLEGWNRLSATRRYVHGLLVADDALGGFFAWFQEPRTIHYFAPDTLEWEDLGLGYTNWLAAMLSQQFDEFYAGLRWPGWEEEVARLDPDQGLHVYPPLAMQAEGPRDRKAVPMEELWGYHMDLAEQLTDLPDGAAIDFRVD